jgi:hypothetical protein
MPAIRFKINVDQTGQIAAPVLNPAQLRGIGEEMVRSQKARWSRGVNIYDHNALPLARVTAKGKATYRGMGSPKRDMVMTGLTSDNFTLRKATMQEIRAENTSREGRRRARQAQSFEPMIGLAPSDQDNIFAAAYRAYGVYLQRAWRPTRG